MYNVCSRDGQIYGGVWPVATSVHYILLIYYHIENNRSYIGITY